ncbi:MAG: GNAT family N-acetyltransferase [Oscillospiraceae bacterium]|nr:GNAT family N-acetyltransferase [Oscillospiraceae bacterium]
MQNVTIKIASIDDDIEQIISIVKKYREFYNINEQDENEIEVFIRERLINNDSKIFIAINETIRKIIGFIQLYPLFSTVSLKRQWILNDLYVIDSERKNGIATELMNNVFDYFKDKAKGCILVTSKTNIPAKQFYDKLGWKTGDYDFYTYCF